VRLVRLIFRISPDDPVQFFELRIFPFLMPALSFWESILAHLKQPEYVHVLLNPLPIYGLALGALALVVAMFLRNRGAQITALILIFIGAGSTIPVIHYGDAGYDVIESDMSSDQADAWLDAHGQRALRAAPAFDALIALSPDAGAHYRGLRSGGVDRLCRRPGDA
jgi:hypothetical protein